MAGLTAATAEAETLMGTGEEAIVGLESHITCPDHVQHKDWIPIASFDERSLPDPFKNENVKGHILHKVNNVVRISRGKNSPHRSSEFNYDPDKTRCGSGTFFFTDDLDERPCPLPECSKKKPHRAIVNIQILTGPHVIFDDLEAGASIIDFFFDTQDGSCAIKAQGHKIKKFAKNSPHYCIVECVCHDLSLLDKLKEHHNSIQRFMTQIQNYASAPAKEKLLVFLAHPHGLAKHIAFGTVKKKQKKDSLTERLSANCRITQCHLKYSVPGCQGSGGGSLIEVGSDGSCYTFALHMGRDGDGIRYSGLGWTAE